MDIPGTIRVALLGDTMLGRGVGSRIAAGASPDELVQPELSAVLAQADLRFLNLECCISDRGTRWPAMGKPFFFRAPPAAAELMACLRTDAVTLANNHALDFGYDALGDTLALLDAAGVAHVGAGSDADAARAPAYLDAGGMRLALIGFADHPADFAATADRPGIAYADLGGGTLPRWLTAAIREARGAADAVVVIPHWGPNMTVAPVDEVVTAGAALLAAGADLIAGHSAHVVHGVRPPILYDLGDFIDDYAVDPVLRNDLGLAWLVTLDRSGPVALEAVPLRIEYAHTRLADAGEAAWIADHFRSKCAEMGTAVEERDGRLWVALDHPTAPGGPFAR